VFAGIVKFTKCHGSYPSPLLCNLSRETIQAI
jgi:hypothetical protein